MKLTSRVEDVTDDSREKRVHNDHNVYILGAGFTAEAGLPFICDFMNRMRDAVARLRNRVGATKKYL
jgi:hypothetical protein